MWILTDMDGLDIYQTIVGTVGAIIAIIVGFTQLMRWLNNRGINNHPWKITFSSKTREQIKTDSDMASNIKIPIGKTTILMRIKMLRPSDPN